jgi:hypothetical protein
VTQQICFHQVFGFVLVLILIGCQTTVQEIPRQFGDNDTIPVTVTEPINESTPPITEANLLFSGEEAFRHAEVQMSFGPRPIGSVAHQQTGDYLLQHLELYGLEAESQTFEVNGTEIRNIVGIVDNPGESVIILGAHYDTRLKADQDSANPEVPVPGANDGASGVAVLLELARTLDRDSLLADVWFVFFDAEDNGRIGEWDWIVGSTGFAEQLDVIPDFVIIVDMIGDVNQEIYFEANSDPLLRNHIWQTAADLGYQDYFIPEVRHSMLDDHTPFLSRGITAIDIIDFDYPYWHTTQDTLDKISADSLERVGRTLEEFLESGGTYLNE